MADPPAGGSLSQPANRPAQRFLDISRFLQQNSRTKRKREKKERQKTRATASSTNTTLHQRIHPHHHSFHSSDTFLIHAKNNKKKEKWLAVKESPSVERAPLAKMRRGKLRSLTAQRLDCRLAFSRVLFVCYPGVLYDVGCYATRMKHYYASRTDRQASCVVLRSLSFGVILSTQRNNEDVFDFFFIIVARPALHVFLFICCRFSESSS